MNVLTLVVVVASGFGLALGACGSDDSASIDAPEVAEMAIVTLEAFDRPGGRVSLNVNGPDRIEAGLVEISFKNAGDRSHDAQIVRVDGDRSADEVVSATVGEDGMLAPDWVTAAGGVGQTRPGQIAKVTQVFQPGTYFVLDGATAVGGGEAPNARRGGVLKLTVTGDPSEAKLSATDASITARDFAFDVDGLQAGTNRLTFENVGKQPHHVVALPLLREATIDQARRFLASSKESDGSAPVDFENAVGTAVLDTGQGQIAELALANGRYALVCFITNRGGGPPHVAMGMIDEVDVK